MVRYGYVYIVASKGKRLYVGVTTRLESRIWEHKYKTNPRCFTAKYNIDQLVYFERHPLIAAAIAREKELKGWLRVTKIALIVAENPTWKDLSLEWGRPVRLLSDADVSGLTRIVVQPWAEYRDPSLRSG